MRRAEKAPPPTYYKVNVVGASQTGKSSVVKRLVCHRFDNLPTRNSQFMGCDVDGRHVVRETIPQSLTRKPRAEEREALIEINDCLAHNSADAFCDERTWWELAFDRGLARKGACTARTTAQ